MIKNFRRIALSAVDSIKYENGELDENVRNYWSKRNAAVQQRVDRKNAARETRKEELAERRERNIFIDPHPNRISAGAQAISTSLFIVKPIFWSADISAALGTHLTYERSIAKSRVGLAASGFWSWNKVAQGGMVSAKYYVINRQEFRVGAGPFFSYARTYFRDVKRKGRYDEFQSVAGNRDTTLHLQASSIGLNYGIQVNVSKRYFISNEFFVGGTNYKGTSESKAFLAYRFGVGIKF